MSADLVRALATLAMASLWAVACAGDGRELAIEVRRLELPASILTTVELGPDATGNGLGDLVVGNMLSSSADRAEEGEVVLVEGETGEVAWSRRGSDIGEHLGSLVSIGGDVDGDGSSEVLVAMEPDFVYPELVLLSGRDGREIRRFLPPLAHCGNRWEQIDLGADVDGDARADVAAVFGSLDPLCDQMPQGVVLSSASGAELATWADDVPHRPIFARQIVLGPDLDSDGVPDVVRGYSGSRDDEVGSVAAYSGVTGVRIVTWSAPPRVVGFPHHVSYGTDVDGDGGPDLVVTALGAIVVLHPTAVTMVAALAMPLGLAAGVHDVSGDGLGDLLGAAPGVAGTESHHALVMVDARTGHETARWFPATDTFRVETLGPDMNGDGLADAAGVDASRVVLLTTSGR